MIDQTKPPLNELAHYGVLGMKWGHTRARASGGEIRDARERVYQDTRQYKQAKAKASGTADPKKRAAAYRDLKKMDVKRLKNPDRVIANRLTRGEKAIAILFLTPVGASAVIGTTSAYSRRIERKQEKGLYDRKKN